MTNDDWKTLRVPVEAWEKAKAQKEAEGLTWGEQIVRPDDDAEDGDLENIVRRVVREELERTDVDDETSNLKECAKCGRKAEDPSVLQPDPTEDCDFEDRTRLCPWCYQGKVEADSA